MFNCFVFYAVSAIFQPFNDGGKRIVTKGYNQFRQYKEKSANAVATFDTIHMVTNISNLIFY